MSEEKKKTFLKPKLIKFDKPLDEVTLWQCGSPCNRGCDSMDFSGFWK
jgi:hypothetical protein